MGFSRQEYWSGLPFPMNLLNCTVLGLPVIQWLICPVVNNLLANTEDMGSIPGSGEFHLAQSK